jgi:hypothetical protein
MADLNAQLNSWRADIANVRIHGTTRRVISEAFAEEQRMLRPLPGQRFSDVLKLERRVSHDGMVSVDRMFRSTPAIGIDEGRGSDTIKRIEPQHFCPGGEHNFIAETGFRSEHQPRPFTVVMLSPGS